MNKRLSILFIFMLTFQTISGSLFLPSQAAAEGSDSEQSVFTGISFTDEDGKAVNNDEMDGESAVNVHVDWSIEHVEVEEGSTDSFLLPDELHMEEEQQGALTDGEKEVGTYQAAMDGEVSVSFNDVVEEYTAAEGTFVVNAVAVEQLADQGEEAVEEEGSEANQEEEVVEEEFEEAATEEDPEKQEAEAIDESDEQSLNSEEIVEEDNALEEDITTFNASAVESLDGNLSENIFTFVSLTHYGNEIVDGSFVDISDGTQVEIEFAWDTEGLDVQSGDTVSMQLPDTFEQVTTPNTPIVTSGTTVGTYSIQDGELIFVFDDTIEDGDVSNGEVGLNLDFNLQKFEENIEQVIQFSDSDNTEINVMARPTNTAEDITKEGHPDQSHNASEITWTVEVINNSDEAVSDATLSDVLPDGLGSPENFVVTELSTGLNGDKAIGEVVDDISPSVDGNEFNFAFDDLEPYQGYRIEYATAVTDRDQTEFTNDATFYNGEENLLADATVSGLTASNPVEKSGSYNNETGQIDWTIVANENGFNIESAIIDDDLPAGLTVDGDTLTVEKYVDGSHDESIRIDTNDFPIELGGTDANEHYVINFSTDIDYEEVNESEYQRENSFTNVATLKDGDEELAEDDTTVEFNREPLLEKSGESNVDYENKTLSWTIDVNKAQHPLNELVITDMIPAGLSITEEDIVITNENEVTVEADIEIIDDDQQEVVINLSDVGTQHITIEYTTEIEDFEIDSFKNAVGIGGDGIGEGDHDTGAQINPPGNSFGKTYVEDSINYNEKTMEWQLTVNPRREAIDELQIVDTFPNKGLILLPGTLSITVDGQDITGSVDLSPNTEDGETGYQKGFTLDFDDRTLPLNNNVIVTYKTSYDPQEEVEGDFLDPHEGEEQNQIYDNEALFTGTTVNENDFEPVRADYVEVREDSWNSGKKEGQLVSVDEEGNIVNDNDWQSGSERKIAWQLFTNYQQQNLGTGVVITDTLEYEGAIDEGSVTVTVYDVDADGDTSISEDATVLTENEDYTIEHAGDEFTLTFNDDFTVDERYVVEFTTTVPNISQENYTNEATVSVGDDEYPYTGTVSYDNYNNFLDKSAIGQEGSEVYIGDKVNWEVKVNDSLSIINNAEIKDIISDGMEYVEGTLEISTGDGNSLNEGEDYIFSNTKTEDDRTILSIELSESLNQALNQALTLNYTTVVTAEDGDTVSNEVSLNGEDIEVDSISSQELTAEEFSWVSGEFNENRGALQIVKADSETGDPIENNSATFELYYDLNGERVQFGDQFEIEENGEIVIGNLPLRTYYLQEVEAPTGYTIDEEEQVIEVTEPYGNEEHVYESEFLNTKIKTDISVTKEWDDADNQDDLRPGFIEVQLLANDEEVGDAQTLSDDSEWAHTWTDLDEYQSNGQIIDYTVEEVNVPNGYESSIDVDEDGYITITNSHAPEMTQVSVSKEWDDANDQDGVRPTNVTVNLLADGEIESQTVLNEDKDWEHLFADLPVYENGEEISYSVTEDAVTDYSTDIKFTGTEEEPAYTVINSYTPGETSVTVTKAWDDADNQDGNRPETLEVQLLANGEEHGNPVTLDGSDWSHTWNELDANSNGEPIEYTVQEIEVPEDYEVSVNDDDHGNIIITNSYEPETTEIAVSKSWDDANDQDGVRPTNVTVNLLADGEIESQTVLNEDKDWEHLFTDLPVYENGEEISYSVTEDTVTDYSTDVKFTGTEEEPAYTVINSYTPGETSVTVTKGWDDATNQDGNRPTSIEVQLTADGEAHGEPVTLNQSNWTHTWGELDANANGQPIEYTVQEIEVAEGYEVSVNDADHGNIMITNSYEPETTERTVRKAWDDADNQDGIRHDNVTVNLLANGEVVSTTVLDDENDWQHTFSNLPVNQNGEEINYRVTENNVANYTASIDADPDNENGFVITNSYTPEETAVTVTKAWNDGDNQDGNRPDTIEVQLIGNDEEIGDPVEIDASNDWTHQWTGLDLNEDGEAIEYTVVEQDVPEEYTVTVNNNDHGNIIITNNYTPEVTEIPVTKVWDDDKDRDRVRASNVRVILLADGTIVEESILNEARDWEHTFTNLPVYEDGTEVNYSVTELTVPEYSTSVEADDDGFVVTNSYTPEETTATVIKNWNDADNQDGIRPESIEVQLTANGEATGYPVEIDAEDGWTYTWDSLPLNADGEAINYSVEELNVPEGYETAVNDEDHGNLILKNNHTPEEINITGTKNWDDADNQDGIRPEAITVNLFANDNFVESVNVTESDEWNYSFEDLPKFEAGEEINYTITENKVEGYEPEIDGFDITNTHTPEVIDVNGTKTWDDADNQDGIRPESITVNLLADGEPIDSTEVTADDDWSYSFTELPKFEAGEEIVYTVTENTVEDYTQTINGFDIKNEYTPSKTAVTVTKNWDDAFNQDGIRPETIEVQLTADGEDQGEPVELSEDNNWTHTWTELDEKAASEQIVYSVVEVTELGEYETTTDDEDHGNIIITNSYTPETTAVTGTKTWDDAENQDGIRSESITVNLHANGEAIDSEEVTEEDDWSYNFENLPKYEAGEEITYTITEDEVEGYETEINGFDITNTHTPEMIDVNGTKTWDDANNQDGIRSESITVNLHADGDLVDTAEVTAADNWNYMFTDLPKYKDGTEIDYTITEETVEAYETEIDGFNITNSYTPETTEITGIKTWDDADNQDGNRPDSITVNLLANGEQVDSVEVTAEDDWEYSFIDLPKYEAGEEIVYTVTENPVEGYTQTIDGFDMTNQYTPGQTAVTVTKNWDDANNQDSIRPEVIEVQLTADGEEQGEAVELSDENNWTHTWTELDEKVAGETIDYSVVELTEVPEYETTVNDADHGNIIITNAYTPEEIEISGTKTWEDADNKDNTRPESIIVNILANGEVVHSIEVTEADDWNYSFTNLPKYEAGKEVVYSVSEDTVEGYESRVEGYDITNTVIPVTPETEELGGTTPDSTDKPSGSAEEVSGTTEPADTARDTGSKLPDTATNMFNLLVLGIGLLIVGIVILLAYRRKEKAS
ncbi:LPXTG-motif cell wall-anchored protein [Virgibacillus natechei]|uniref:LPXTG-motif cell wall-anchored protein n=1 Tax=Virgibacillus natechei TaxID=1216297 RepID=A0ABS4IC67_9BACI|nr:Cna B-type domain-containing protein [Virgibacillus natechei]MBP1968503.1 LPXTG-motif cell wall-anchored protein [Virgibacillus natechei]UZD13620.1 Cna B-type domain-containing protein [Virgibacillus natechei]